MTSGGDTIELSVQISGTPVGGETGDATEDAAAKATADATVDAATAEATANAAAEAPKAEATAEVTADATAEATADATAEAVEQVRALFEFYGSGAVEETVLCDADGDGEPDRPSTWLRTYVDAGDAESRLKLEIGLWRLTETHGVPEASVRLLSEANWAEAWKAHYEPIRVGEHIVVTPPWREPDTVPGDLVVTIDPGMAFGTGLHATTQMCLSAVERLAGPGVSVLDIGIGSGVLAIGAALMGAERVVGVDIAPHAATTATENAAANGVGLDVMVGQVTALPPERFDLVLANLLAVTVVEEALDIAARVAQRGTIVVSGVLVDQVDETMDALSDSGLAKQRVEVSGDWAAIWARPQSGESEAGVG